nr:hypothetical protein [Tanacetum cinerariifolium]
YALTVNPNIYVPCIKQFWTTVVVKKVNDVTRLQALVDKKKVVVTEATIRDILHLDDAEAQEVGEGVAYEMHDEGVPVAGIVAEGDVSAVEDRLKRVGLAQRIDTSDGTVMDDVSNQERMIADMDVDADVVLEEAKDVVVDAKADQDADVQVNADI